jgi:Family of unknown function (DUF5691)
MVMNSWETLVASALVGIDRQSPTIDLTHPALIDYAEALPSQSTTHQILGAAGLISSYQLVGQSVVATSRISPEPARAEQLICCLPQTAQYLIMILQENRYGDILSELLQLLADNHQTVPPDFLPLLLNAGKKDKKIRPFILPVLGHLGKWLVRQNPQWEYGAGATITDVDLASIQEVWATGSRSERSAALSQWRELQPVESRQALTASWKQEKADDRAAWLEILQVGLSLADEEFLEVALVDRSEPVRCQAVHLLNQLPSQYRQRLTKLATELLVIKDVDGYQLQINLPQADAVEWIAVGLLDKPSSKAGAKPPKVTVEQLSPVFVGADLDVWPPDIDRLVTSIQSLTTGHTILSGLAAAACYQKRLDWIAVLIDRSPTVFTSIDAQILFSLLNCNNQALKEQLFTHLLNAADFLETLPHTLDIMMHDQYWSKSLSSLALQKIHQYIQHRNHYYYIQQLINISSRLDVSVLPELQEIQTTCSPDKFNYAGCIEYLEFRRNMRAVFDTT